MDYEDSYEYMVDEALDKQRQLNKRVKELEYHLEIAIEIFKSQADPEDTARNPISWRRYVKLFEGVLNASKVEPKP